MIITTFLNFFRLLFFSGFFCELKKSLDAGTKLLLMCQ